MLFEKNTLYQFDETKAKSLLHKDLNKKELIIVLKQNLDLEPEIKEMLDKMVAALKIQSEQVEYLIFKDPIFLPELIGRYAVRNVLSFGAETTDLGIALELPKYKFHHLDNMSLLMVNSVIDVYNNQNLKGKLWNELKTISVA